MNDDATPYLPLHMVGDEGYTELWCDDCAEILYRGRYITNVGEVIAAHDLACAKPLSSMPKRSRLRAFVDRLRPRE